MNMIGQRIKQLRTESGMTQHQLAVRLGVSTSTVGMYESGHRSPDNEMLVKIGSVFSVTSQQAVKRGYGYNNRDARQDNARKRHYAERHAYEHGGQGKAARCH